MAPGPGGVRRILRVTAWVALASSVAASAYAGARLADPSGELDPLWAGIVLFVFLNGMAVVWSLAYLGFCPDVRGAGVVGLVLNWLVVGSADAVALLMRKALEALVRSRSQAEALVISMAVIAAGLVIMALMGLSLLVNLLMVWWLARAARRAREA